MSEEVKKQIIKEAWEKFPFKIVGGHNDYDENEKLRLGYQVGAEAWAGAMELTIQKWKMADCIIDQIKQGYSVVSIQSLIDDYDKVWPK
jgi:hypothetical protein